MSQRTDDTYNRAVVGASRGVIARTDDDKKMQRQQARMLSNETLDDIEHFQPYGFTSVPKGGAETLVIFVGGNRSHPISIVSDDRRYRLRSLEAGEVALYTDEGTSVVVRRGRVVEVTCDEYRVTCKTLTLDASESVTVTSPSVDVNES